MTQIEALVDAYEARTLSRRELIAAVAALVAPAIGANADAQSAPIAEVAQGRSLNHASLAVSDVSSAADFYQKLLGLRVVSRPGNGGINLGLGDGFLGLYKLPNPGTVNHVCIGVNDFDPERIAARLTAMGVTATIDRNPANRTSGGDQLYFNGPDNCRIQLGAHGYQG
ncbi:MAG TPA: VOC family protein [Vicinamibacterales bacterium]|jgi:catechol 2,3-dioxygenase-like lactoylglutathione lyase family enzyme